MEAKVEIRLQVKLDRLLGLLPRYCEENGKERLVNGSWRIGGIGRFDVN